MAFVSISDATFTYRRFDGIDGLNGGNVQSTDRTEPSHMDLASD